MKHFSYSPNFLLKWIPLAFVTTILFGTMYAVVQQNYRQSANDPQIQMARDGVIQLNMGKKIPFTATVDIATSLSPFIMIFDSNGKVVTSQAVLNGNTPVVPNGVFSYTKNMGEDKFTWQPAPTARIAAVVDQYNNGYILVGRNIKEIEKRELQLEYVILAGWIISLVGSAVLKVFIK